MAHDPFKDFKIPDEDLRWDRYVKRARSNTNLTAEEALKAELALLFLKKHLGDDAWLAQAMQNHHPITGYLWNDAPHSQIVLIRMAEAMEAFDQKKNSNYSSVISRLRKPDKFNEANSVLETGYKFQLLGFEVVFDPSVTINRKDGSPHGKVPDLKITCIETGEEMFVEVSTLGLSAQQRQITRGETTLTMRLLHVMHATGVIMRVRAHKALDKVTLASALQQIDKLAAKAKTDGAFETWTSEGVIELAAAPTDQAESIYQWASERGIEEREIIVNFRCGGAHCCNGAPKAHKLLDNFDDLKQSVPHKFQADSQFLINLFLIHRVPIVKNMACDGEIKRNTLPLMPRHAR